MGGTGSGRGSRWGAQTTVEECHSVDVRFLKRRGYLKAGITGSLSWTYGGEPSGNIHFITHLNSIRLIYKCRPVGGEWEDRQEVIEFDRTPCHYGNYRIWLLCPCCGKRVTSVYGLISGFFCRHCHALPYASQRELKIDRMIRKRRKVSARLESSAYYEKPKGMHWGTYNKLIEHENSLSQEIDSAIYGMSAALRKKY